MSAASTTSNRLLLTLDAAAEEMSVSRKTVERMIGRKDLKTVPVGRRGKRVTRASIEEYIQCHTESKEATSGGSPTPTKAATELENLLRQRAKPKLVRLKRRADLKSVA